MHCFAAALLATGGSSSEQPVQLRRWLPDAWKIGIVTLVPAATFTWLRWEKCRPWLLLMGPDRAFITGNDFLMDGGVTATFWFGDLAPSRPNQ